MMVAEALKFVWFCDERGCNLCAEAPIFSIGVLTLSTLNSPADTYAQDKDVGKPILLISTLSSPW